MARSGDLDGGFSDADPPRGIFLPTDSPLKLGARSLSADEEGGNMDGSPSIFDDLIAWGAHEADTYNGVGCGCSRFQGLQKKRWQPLRSGPSP